MLMPFFPCYQDTDSQGRIAVEDLPTEDIFHNFALLVLWFPFISEGVSVWQCVDGSSRRVFWFLFTVKLALPF